MLDEQSSQAQNVLHKTAFSDEALLRFTAQYEASPLRSDMKHSLRSYDEKMKNVSLSVCSTTPSALYYRRKGPKRIRGTPEQAYQMFFDFA